MLFRSQIRLIKAKGGPRLTPEQNKAAKKAILEKKGGTLYYLNEGNEEAIKVYYGSREQYEAIPDSWDDIPLFVDDGNPIVMDHGYDETKPESELCITDMQQAAAFRGGKCLSETMETGNLMMPLRWQCALGHEFEAKPNTVLKLGHWCPDCLCGQWDYFTMAKVNPYFAQSWDYLHSKEEPFTVKMEADAKTVEAMFE